MSGRGDVRALVVVLALAAFAPRAHTAATITIVNMDGPGEGFNDPTPATPVGGNPGTTVGEQRLRCFEEAAAIWGAILDSPVPILVRAAFNPLSCTATTATLGSAGARYLEVNFAGAEFSNHWYHEALANQQAGVDLTPATQSDDGSDINARFNSGIGQPGCLSDYPWYYGFDHAEGQAIDLLPVILHEFGHGLGFSSTTSSSSGNYHNGFPGLWDRFLYGETTGLHWDEMTPAQRVASATDTNQLTWDGDAVSFRAPFVLSRAPELVLESGPGPLEATQAEFGAAVTDGGVTAPIVLVDDGVGNGSDGCQTPYTNAAALAGAIALVDRGSCAFVPKAQAAQQAGAVALVIANDVAGYFSPGGTDPSITIPVVSITQTDGASLESALLSGPVTGTIRLSETRRSGTHVSGRVRMFAPNPIVPGSSIGHFDVSAVPNLLMEPYLQPDLTSDVDLTREAFEDLGWLPRLTAVAAAPSPSASMRILPNPVARSAALHFVLPREEAIEISLLDLTGRRVATLANGRFGAGPHDVKWNGAGRSMAPGVYLARLRGEKTSATVRLVVVH